MYLIIRIFFNQRFQQQKNEFHLQIKISVVIHWKHIARPRIAEKQISASFEKGQRLLANSVV